MSKNKYISTKPKLESRAAARDVTLPHCDIGCGDIGGDLTLMSCFKDTPDLK